MQTTQIPKWLVDLGATVDPLVRDHAERFATMLEAWAEQQRTRGPLSKRGPFARIAIGGKLTTEDMYAMVAAIHCATLPSFAGSWGDDGAAFTLPDGMDDANVTMQTIVGVSDDVGMLFLALVEHVTDPYTCTEAVAPALQACVERVRADLAKQPKPKQSNAASQPQDADVTAAIMGIKKSKYWEIRERYPKHFPKGPQGDLLFEARAMAWMLSQSGDDSETVCGKINTRLKIGWKNGAAVRQSNKIMRKLCATYSADPLIQDDNRKRADRIIKTVRKHPGYRQNVIPNGVWYWDDPDPDRTDLPPDLNGNDPTKHERRGLEAQARSAAVEVLAAMGTDKDAENAAKRVLDRWKRDYRGHTAIECRADFDEDGGGAWDGDDGE